jgi:hypothetical protein
MALALRRITAARDRTPDPASFPPAMPRHRAPAPALTAPASRVNVAPMRRPSLPLAQVLRALPALALVTSSCSLTMPVPPDVARDMTPITITNRGTFTGSWANEGFTMGPYQVANVDRSGRVSTGISGSAGPDLSAGSTRSRSGYRYTFVAAGGPSQGECTTELVEQSAQAGGFNGERERSRIACRCGGAGLTTEVVLEGPDAAWQGNANLHGYAIPMRAIEQYANGVHSQYPLGYDVRGQVAVGAVEVKRPGRVWLSQTLDPQSHAELACLFAGLLLFETPKSGAI